MKKFLSARWEDLIMVNYEISPTILSPYLPKGVELDFYNGKCFVSLVGFLFKKIRIFGIPIPYMGNFEEINLRFYVKRIDNGITKRGVVFIGETVPFAPVAWLANTLYKEHYSCIPTRHSIVTNKLAKEIKYEWKKEKIWNYIDVTAAAETTLMQTETIEEFIFEHYYGYTKTSEHISQEYRVNHPRWRIHNIQHHNIKCNFESMYGKDFSCLNSAQPHSIIMADGSDVSIDWKRMKF